LPERIDRIDVFEFRRERDDAYLGGLTPRDVALNDLHIVREFNGTVYPTADRSVVIRVTDTQGAVGWGETYGLVAPGIVADLVDELFGPYIKSLPAMPPDTVWDALYELQRVRGYWGGYLADTLAGLDIALWDLYSRAQDMSLQAALGQSGAGEIGAYVSGLPCTTTEARVELAQDWQSKGFHDLKIPVSATTDGDVRGEFEALRGALGDDHRIALDLHWTLSIDETLALERDISPFDPWFLEAPTKPEDIEAQRAIGNGLQTPLALGEEWRTEWDYRARRGICDIVQPEMGHTGITQFMRIAELASENNAQVFPHATIGLGIFMAASLRASLAAGARTHEFQHTIYDRNAALLDGASRCAAGCFEVPDSPGHGVEPNADAFRYLTKINK
jgi:galactonate dehydratase